MRLVRRELEKRIASIRERIDQLIESHIHDKAIDRATFQARKAREDEKLAQAELELADTEIDLDVEGALAFGERLITNAADTWTSLDIGRKIQLQNAFSERNNLRWCLVWNPGSALCVSAICREPNTRSTVWRP